jgi:hypothetical protein
MNCTLLTADAATHAKIVIVALLAGIAVMWIGIGTQLRAAKPLAAGPHFQLQIPQPGGLPASAPALLETEIA